jgi:TnpA family transposase
MPRMRILNAIEHYDFDSPPVFNSLQRKKYFDFSDTVYRMATGLRSPTHQLGFLVSCGYFPATKKFFSAKDFHLRDIEYVANKLGLSVELFDREEYNDRTRQRHQQIILKFYGYRAFDDLAKALIREEIDTMVRSQLKPRLIFWRCVERLIREKVQLPGCFTLTDLITGAINWRKETLNDILRQQLSEERREQLEALFVQMPVEGEQQPGPTSAYQLTLLKKLSQSTRPSKIKERVADFLLIERLYQPFQPLLNVLGLNHEGIRYYAHSVLKSEIFQVARRSDEDRYLHVVAFIAHQYYRLQDNLVDGLLTSIQSYQNTSQREHKEQRYAQRGERNQVINTLLSYIDENLLGLVSAIEAITQEKVLSDAEKVERIKALLPEHNDQALSLLREKLATELGNDDYHRILEARSVRLQNRVSPVLKVLEFQGEPSAQPLRVALRYFKDKDGQIDKAAPMKFLTEEEANAIMAGDRFRVSLYKAFLFLHVQKGIKSGTLNLYHSYKYRPLEEYFIETDRWQQDKNILLERAGLLSAFTDPQPVLAELDEALFQQYEETNRRIADGSNASVSFDAQGRFQLKTPPQEAQEATPLRHFFPERQYISLLEVLSTVDRHSGFLDEFQHWQQRYHRQRPAKQTFFAGIIGLGCEIGTPKMARISQAINESELEHTVNWYFSLEGTRAANDRVSALMDQLELPETYRRIPGQLHTSSDGQKFEVVNDSLNASYSFKYAGKDQASSAYSFIDERHILWYSMVFSAAERESAFVIDGLMHNDVIKSDIHSTDTHGYSEALFGATHLLGFSYAPRIKNLKKQTLSIFKSRRHTDRAHWKIQPSNYIDTDIIIRHWDDILRLIATIKLKEVTASEIFRRLNSYSTQHSLYRALKAFGQIIKSLFILRYIDDMNLRQAIEKQLNKIEHSHKFARAVSVGNPKELIETEKQEQEIAESCKRLIKNCIICWNYLYLIQKLSETDDPGYKAELLKALSNGSVISWWHINLLGEYDFSEEKLRDTVGIKLPKLTA